MEVDDRTNKTNLRGCGSSGIRLAMFGWRRPGVSVLTCLIGGHTCHIRNGKLNCTHSSFKALFVIMIHPVSSSLSLSHPQLYHHQGIRNYFFTLYLPIPWSWVNTEYSLPQVQHTSSTASTQHQLYAALMESLICDVSTLGGPCWTLLYTFPWLQANQ